MRVRSSVSNLPFGASVSTDDTSKAHQAHVSSLSRQTLPVSGQLYGIAVGGTALLSRFSVAFRLPAFASWAFLFPPRNSAFLAISLPFTTWSIGTSTGFPCSARTRYGRGRGRVGPPHRCGGPPSEPDLNAFHSSGSSKPYWLGGGQGCWALGDAGLSRRAQWACMRRSATGSSDVPCPASAVIACLRIALRVTLTHVSHSCGVCGSWSACSSSSRQSGQRPCCAWSRRSRDRSSGGVRRRRRVAQYSTSAGSSGDVPALTSWCRTICVQANLARKAPLSRSPKIHLSCLVLWNAPKYRSTTHRFDLFG
jgi:hypothetical protein